MIVGNAKANKMAGELFKRESLSVVLSGPEGVGKKSKALELIGQILNSSKTEVAFNADLFFVEPANSIIRLEKVRELLSFATLKSYSGGRRFALIDDAHLMNLESQNALLKLIEEPPAGLSLVLITSQYDQLIPTIRSRLVNIAYNSLSDQEVKLALGRELSPELLALAGGSVSKAYEYLNYDMGGLSDFVSAFLYRDGTFFSKDPEREDFLIMARYGVCVLKGMREFALTGESNLYDARVLQAKLKIKPELIDRLLLKLDEAMGLYMGNVNKKIVLADLMMGNF